MTRYAYIEDGVVAEVHYNLPESWRNVSNFHVLLEGHPEHFYNLGWRVIEKFDEDSIDRSIYDIGDPTYSIIDGKVIEHRELRKKNAS